MPLDTDLVEVARRHLPEPVADRWIGLLRPGLWLRKALPGESVVARLGGLPELPRDVGWPRWKGQGWLGFVAAIDCGSLPADSLDIALPGDGTLLFFYRDRDEVVGTWAPETQAGARVTYVPAGVPTSPRSTPSGVPTYREVALTAEAIVTGPDWDHPAFRASITDLAPEHRAFMDDYRNRDDFAWALSDLVGRPWHGVGGHADPVQGPVEMDAAQVVLGGRADWTGPAVHEEAQRWVLLAQIDSDEEANMCWGDVGTLYWLVRPADLRARDFDRAVFTWQCG
ncbi:YwqG family protein [Asanoa iriomotensis]|uniref:DUF1963 domain-containing protein n=1 Tax=Asanoa iriomotensis TaxID=234613 RepID=A0ABQ4C5V7_9ACTN|nr:YwqG family protein [Asanoa iriomotensis]GIF58139.1 hypothetical protein Air01nite_42340 [Asanoa iriomotensis]